ncbi:hybrid sensor histidine kinase/response regulator [Hymenobacter actinosclerus]|uniref:Sensory/regulatory protein RpfC n=1 Tax=Hymenobacter actinosclerus TaxID=82805 RepID=A0A1I0H4M3_9BACT|nr:hybrid sensor histidine kinase/response regulator [Hymenobacter actinosclerus]SET78527.1 Signal transduction histidine kinase [Hymenobacter actinosclerus]
MRRLLVFFFLLTQFAAAQPLPAKLALKQFGPAEGLPQPFIYALAQDRAGYLWLGTAEGLVRFDGTTFRTFTTREGLAEDFVTRLVLDPRTGRLAVRHFQGGLSIERGPGFRPATPAETGLTAARGLSAPDTARLGRFRRRYRPALPAGLVLTDVLRDAEGTYWLATAGQGLWRLLDPHVALLPLPDLASLIRRGPALLAATRTGQILQLTATPTGHISPQPVPPTATGPMAPDGAGWAVAGAEAAAVWKLRLPLLLNSGTAASRSALAQLPAGLSVNALAQDAAGGLWVGTVGQGAFYLHQGSLRHYTTATGLLHNDIYAILPDRQGRVWFATHGTGLAVLEAGKFRVYRVLAGGIEASALSQDAAGRVWIGTEGDGLLCFENDRFRQFSTRNSGLASNYCYGLLPTPAGLVVQHAEALSLGRGAGFSPLTTPGNPLVQQLLPNAAVLLAGPVPAVLLASRAGLLRVGLPALPAAARPRVALAGVEVDGTRHRPDSLAELPAGAHQLTWFFRTASLAPAGTWQYQYRLRGYQPAWSRPGSLDEADFPRLGPGRYTFEVRARRGAESAWGPATTAGFGIATPFWQTGWFALLSVAVAVGGIWGFLRVRTAALRRQKLQLETTVRERTTELRRQKEATELVNADLLVARDAAEASRRAKAQFLANMSHEIRTPLNAVIGLTHLLRGTRIDAGQQEYLEAIQSSSQNLLVILNDILDSSKMEAGKLTLERVPFRLPALLARVQAMFRFALDAKGLYLRTEIGPDVPEAITGDPVRLQQVLVNLVGNAVKFTAHGGITLLLESGPAADGGDEQILRFGVRDTGIGIAPEQQEAIFEDFSQANASTTRQYGGTGLGLSIARNLVQLHGGRLWVESAEGQGSTFWFDLPARPADPAAIPPEASASLPPFEPALRVLVAEDNVLNQLVARRTLEAWNVRVTVADNGRLAVEAARRQPFDAVLLDVQMPEMDGYEAARQLRQLFPDPQRLPLIGLTASALPEDRVLALAAGMNDTLAKPFDPAVLYARLAHYTGRTPASPTTPAVGAPTASSEPTGAAGLIEPGGPTAEQPDWTLLEELAGGSPAFVGQLVGTFLSQAPPLAQKLPGLSGPALAEAAHKLRGQVAYFGLPQLCQLLEKMEETARQQPLHPALPAQLADVARRLQALYPLLELRLAAG